jgi:hypothetical protein
MAFEAGFIHHLLSLQQSLVFGYLERSGFLIKICMTHHTIIDNSLVHMVGKGNISSFPAIKDNLIFAQVVSKPNGRG